MRKTLLLLGASGNIGTQTLDLLKGRFAGEYVLKGVSVGKNVLRLKEILGEFPSVKWAYLEEEGAVVSLKKEFPDVVFFSGESGLGELVDACSADYVLNAIVGFAGLLPSLRTVISGRTLLLANKESLVVGGELINSIRRKSGARIYPIDSEHVALAKCLSRVGGDTVDHLIITASGGPFYGKNPLELTKITVEEALCHPTWRMGKKITIDSATMVNKGFELVEAAYLFDVDPSSIEVRVDRRSRVHSAVALRDGSYLADVGPSDMHGPIAYALSLGSEGGGVEKTMDLSTIPGTDFQPFDKENCPAISLILEAYRRGGTALASLNAANEEAVSLFLDGKISFPFIIGVCRLSLGYPLLGGHGRELDYASLYEADRFAREATRKTFLNN